MGLRDADSPARWQDAVATGQTGTRTFRNDQYKVRMTTQRYAAATSCHGEDETDCFAIQDGARMNISRQLRLPFFFWVINPISHSVSKYQQHAQRIPILRCSVVTFGRVGARSCSCSILTVPRIVSHRVRSSRVRVQSSYFSELAIHVC